MRDGAYLKRLGDDLARWASSGTISATQADALLGDARARAQVARSSPAAIAAALGAILFGLGVITLIAANWGALPKSIRMGAALVLIWVTFGGAIVAFERSANWLGQALTLAGALAIGAAVALIGQVYHIEGSASGLFSVWAFGALATAIAFRSIPVLILYVILAFLWFAFERPETIFLFDRGVVTGDTWRVYGLHYIPLWLAGAFLARRVDSGAAMHLSGLGAAIWLFLLFGDAIWAGGARHWISAGLMIAAAGAVMGAAGEWARARHGERAGAIALAWGAAGAAAGVVVSQFALWEHRNLPAQMGMAAALLGLSVWAINWGETPGRRSVRGLAIALFGFECFYVYVDLFRGLLDTAFFLLGGGALLMALALALARFTRKSSPSAQAPRAAS